MLSKPIPLRLNEEKKARYEAAAALLDVPLSTYLRKRLESEDEASEMIENLSRQVATLQLTLEDKTLGHQGDFSAGGMNILLEILLLLRLGSKPDNRKMVESEIKRYGLDIWRNDN